MDAVDDRDVTERPSDWWSRAEDLLRRHRADTLEHPGGTLLAHVVRVAHLLEEWGAGEDLQAAGLCHACYGTDGFPVPLLELSERHVLAAAIGSAAESTVYVYAGCERAATYARIGAESPLVLTNRFTEETGPLTEAQARDFLELTAANELDIVLVNPDIARAWGPEFEAFLRGAPQWLSDEALRAWAEAVSRSGAAR